MIRAWALLTCRESRWRWALWREPTRVTGRMSGMGGLPWWCPSGTSAGHAAELAAAPFLDDEPELRELDLPVELEVLEVACAAIVRHPISMITSAAVR